MIATPRNRKLRPAGRLVLAGAALLGLAASAAGAAGPDSPFLRRVRRDTEWLAGRPTRVVGTADHDKTFQELLERIRNTPGLEFWTDEFPVVVPRVIQAELTVTQGESQGTHRVYPLWPASVRLHTTPEDGIRGKLIYIGEGKPGKPEQPGKAPGVLPARSLRGHIAVMEVTGAHAWKAAYNAGARAILLLGSGDGNVHHLHSHLVPIPVWVPRFYVPPGELADALRKETIQEGRLFCRAEWTEITVANVYVLVKPAAPTAQPALAIGVPFDSAGVVPGRAPGADAAVDLAVALNALDHFARHRPARPLLFAFVDAYGISQLGLREMLLALAVEPTEKKLKELLEDDRKLEEEYREHKALALELDLDRASLDRLYQSRYKPLRRYVKDEVARDVVAIETEMHPKRLRQHKLLRRRNEIDEEFRAGRPSPAETEALQNERAALQAELDVLQEQVDRLAGARTARYAAQKQLLSSMTVKEDDASLALAQELWKRARYRARAQHEELAGFLRRHAERDALRRGVLLSLGLLEGPSATHRPISFLFGLDLSDAGVAAGPCLSGRHLLISEKKSAESFTRWLEQVNRTLDKIDKRLRGSEEKTKRPKLLWPEHVRGAVDLTPVTGTDAPGSYLVGNLALFSAPAQSFGVAGITWATLDAQRLRADTPSDTAAKLDWARLGPQVEAVFVLLKQMAAPPGAEGLLDTDREGESAAAAEIADALDWDGLIAEADEETLADLAKLAGAVRFKPLTKIRAKWQQIRGTIVDQSPGEPVPRLPMPGYLTALVCGNASNGRTGPSFSPVGGIRCQEFRFTGTDGQFRFEGFPGRVHRRRRRYHVQSYRLAKDGRIIRAINVLKAGKGVRLTVDVGAHRPKPLRATVFTCDELTLLGLFDPRFLVNLPSGQVRDAERSSVPQRMNLNRYGSMLSCQLEPNTRWQLILRAGIAGNRMALLNMAEPQRGVKLRDLMRGFPIGEPLPEHPLHIAARDFYRLDRKRLDDYAAAGITNKAIQRLREQTGEQLARADRAVEEDDGAGLMRAAGGAMSNEVRAYRATGEMANDVIRGAIFLLLMLVPFSYALERLAFASAHVYKQIAGVIGLFTVMAAILWQYHPAFEISNQPMMIVMAFAIIFMSLTVISVIYSKFRSGLEELRSGRAETGGARTSRVGLFYTAFRLGIANMRRRKFRTVLTGTTVVLITFAMLCFMSTSHYIGQREFSIGAETTDPGSEYVLIRQPSSRAMPSQALTHLAQAAGEGRQVLPRYWWTSQSSPEWRIHVRNPANGKMASLRAGLGVAPEEGRIDEETPGLTELERACPNWPQFAEHGGCYLPQEAADKLGVRPGDTVVIAGQDLKLIGILDKDVLDREIRQLDGQPLLPLDYARLNDEQRRILTDTNMDRLTLELASGSSLEPDEELPHVSADSVALLPAETLARIPGSSLRAVAVTTTSSADARQLAGDFAERLAFPIYYRSTTGTRVLAATPLLPRAPKSLIIPVIIAGLIIFNTMLSSIAERRREIYIYTSLGLAPLHVGFLFLAEAVTYGLMGSIFGYIVGQGTATGLAELGWLGGLTLNYSGTQAIITMAMVLGVVIVSSLVPAFMAGKLAMPSNEMTWKVPQPVDGVIRDKLPFTVTAATANGVMEFLHEYLDAHREGSIGNFATDDLRTFHATGAGPDETAPLMGIQCTAWLAPYDLGIRQRLLIAVSRMTQPAAAEDEDVYSIHIELRRQSGQESSWWKLNRVLLGDLRRQLLGWRKLRTERMLEYIAQAKERLGPATEQMTANA